LTELNLSGLMSFQVYHKGLSLFLFFVLYINYLPQVLNSPCLLFTDDTKVYSSVVDDDDICRMQQDIDNLVLWSKKLQLPFNISKCTTLHLGKANCNHIYTMAGCDLKQTSEEKIWVL